jgi:lipopolysaccharide export system permease protein
MKLIDRYLLREYILVLSYCLIGFSMIFVIYDLFDHLSSFIDNEVSFTLILRYYASLLAPSLEYLAPASLLLATLYTLWQMTRRNELTAMRASGISIYRIMSCFLAVGLFFTFTTALIRECVTPKAMAWLQDFEADEDETGSGARVYHDLPYYSSVANHLWMIGRLDADAPNKLLNVKVTRERPDGSRYEELEADRAEWLDGQWWFYNMTVQKYDEDENPVGSAKPVIEGHSTVTELPFLTEQPQDFVNEITSWDFLPSVAVIRYLKLHKDLSPKDRSQKVLSLHQRLAAPWACFIVTLFAIPAGVRGGRRSALAGVFTTVGYFFGFYSLMQIGLFLGLRGLIWPWLGAWLSNIVFLFTGTVMVSRIQ